MSIIRQHCLSSRNRGALKRVAKRSRLFLLQVIRDSWISSSSILMTMAIACDFDGCNYLKNTNEHSQMNEREKDIEERERYGRGRQTYRQIGGGGAATTMIIYSDQRNQSYEQEREEQKEKIS